MTLDEAAVRVLRNNLGTMEEHGKAGEYYLARWRERGSPMMTYDVVFNGATSSDPQNDGTTTNGGSNTGGAVGSVLVQKLPGPVTSYYIDLDPDTGSAALYRTIDADGVGEGMAAPGAAPRRSIAQLRHD